MGLFEGLVNLKHRRGIWISTEKRLFDIHDSHALMNMLNVLKMEWVMFMPMRGEHINSANNFFEVFQKKYERR
jgi:hypothetical protein